MAGRQVAVTNPETGQVGTVDETDLSRALATGSRMMRPAEVQEHLDARAHRENLGEAYLASEIGVARGFGEAFGVPTDVLATGVADLFGKGNEARRYLSDLRQNHPGVSTLAEMGGQAGGFIAAAELTGGLGSSSAPTALGRIGQATASGAVRGGIENLIAGTTHDVNMESLGDPNVAGQKLWTQAPKHFLVGAAAGGVFGGGFAAAGEALGPLLRAAPGALERQASAAIGRDLGASGEEAVALGGRVRELSGGAVPRDASAVADLFAREQAAAREGAQAARVGKLDALAGEQATQAWQQSARAEGLRKSLLAESKKAISALEAGHAEARTALASEVKEAEAAVAKLAEERAANVRQMKSLASDLDKVKGAELPQPENIFRAANEAFRGGPSMTPPSEGALKVFGDWVEGFAAKYSKPGSLKFSSLRDAIESLDTAETRQRVMSGWGNDPDVKRAFDAIRTAAKDEFDRASASTAGMVSEAKHLNAERLRASAPELEAAFKQASEHHSKVTKAALDFEKQALREVADARARAAAEFKAFEKRSGAEARGLDKRQAAQLRAVPKADKRTPFDDIVSKAKGAARKGAFEGGLGIGGAFGAAASLAHGNVAGAAMGLLGSLAAGRMRASGNYTAAKTFRMLAEQLAKLDDAIAKGAGRVVRGTGRAAGEAGAEKAAEPKARKAPTFEEVAQRVRRASANPALVEMHVRQYAGPLAADAPAIYMAMLDAAQREQDFLASKLPPPQADPKSLRPDLAEQDLSDSEKYDFMQYVKALQQAPHEVLEDVRTGDITDQQVEAMEFARPDVYEQMKAEVRREVALATEEIPYERAVHIGSLLQEETDTVLDPEFQREQALMFSARAEQEKKKPSGGAKPSGESKSAAAAMSASERVEKGEV